LFNHLDSFCNFVEKYLLDDGFSILHLLSLGGKDTVPAFIDYKRQNASLNIS
jgi:hypothetical protein